MLYNSGGRNINNNMIEDTKDAREDKMLIHMI